MISQDMESIMCMETQLHNYAAYINQMMVYYIMGGMVWYDIKIFSKYIKVLEGKHLAYLQSDHMCEYHKIRIDWE